MIWIDLGISPWLRKPPYRNHEPINHLPSWNPSQRATCSQRCTSRMEMEPQLRTSRKSKASWGSCVLLWGIHTQMLHGAGIFTNICPKNHPVLKVNIPAPWSIWGYISISTRGYAWNQIDYQMSATDKCMQIGNFTERGRNAYGYVGFDRRTNSPDS